jgi:hypothetical protein
MNHHSSVSQRFMLWVDAVGGYWVSLADEVVLGQPTAGGADVPILGDISARHARLRRDGEGYLLEPLRTVYVNGRRIERPAELGDGARIQLGEKVRLVFRQPHMLSATARLEFESGHRTQPSADAILLMADSCILGPSPNCHVQCRAWTNEVVLYRHHDDLYCRAAGLWQIDQQTCRHRGRVAAGSHVSGEGFSFSLENIRTSWENSIRPR